MVPVGTQELELGSEQLGWMRESTELLAQGRPAVQQRLAEDGYLLLRGLIEPEKVLRGLEKITGTLGEAGWFVEGSDPLERQLAPAEARRPQEGDLMHCDEVLDVVEATELHDFFAMLWGEEAATFYNKWFRAVGPGGYSGFHSAPPLPPPPPRARGAAV